MVAIFAVACVQIALAIIWRLLSMVSSHSVFSLPAVHWLNGLTLCLALAAVLPSAVLFHLLFVVRVGGPGILLVFGTVVIAGLAVLMLMLVLRRLLITAAGQLDKLGLEI